MIILSQVILQKKLEKTLEIYNGADKMKKEYYVMSRWQSFLWQLERLPYIGGIIRTFTGTTFDP